MRVRRRRRLSGELSLPRLLATTIRAACRPKGIEASAARSPGAYGRDGQRYHALSLTPTRDAAIGYFSHGFE